MKTGNLSERRTREGRILAAFLLACLFAAIMTPKLLSADTGECEGYILKVVPDEMRVTYMGENPEEKTKVEVEGSKLKMPLCVLKQGGAQHEVRFSDQKRGWIQVRHVLDDDLKQPVIVERRPVDPTEDCVEGGIRGIRQCK